MLLVSFCFQIDTEQLLAHLVETEMIKRTVSSIVVTISWFFVAESVHSDWGCLIFRKKEDTREGSSVQSVISLDIRLEDLYRQILTATMLM